MEDKRYSFDELAKMVSNDISLKSLLYELIIIAKRRIESGYAAVYYRPYANLKRNAERYEKDEQATDDEKNNAYDDVKKYLAKAEKQYIDNVLGTNDDSVKFTSFDGKISTSGSKAESFFHGDNEIIKVYDSILSELEINRIKEDKKEDKKEDDSSDLTNHELESEISNEQSEQENNSPRLSMDDGTPDYRKPNTTMESDVSNFDFAGPASVVQYRLLIKKEMDKVGNQIQELKSKLPSNEEVDLSNSTFKKILKLKQKYNGLKAKYDETLKNNYESSYLDEMGVLNTPISAVQQSLVSFDQKKKELDRLLSTLKSPTEKGLTKIHVSLVEKICNILKSINCTANSIQRGLILPKGILDIISNNYFSYNKAKGEYYDTIISDVESKIESLDDHESIISNVSKKYNNLKLYVYRRKKEIVDDLLSKNGFIPIITITGARIRACKRDILFVKNELINNDDSMEITSEMSR